MVDIAIVLKSLSEAIKLASTVADAKSTWEQADLKLKMAEVTSALADAKNALTDTQTELREKDQEIGRLKNAFTRAEGTVEYKGKHYRKGPDGKPIGRPFCPVCWEDHGRLFLLDRDKGTRGAMRCARCKAQFEMLAEFGEPEA